MQPTQTTTEQKELLNIQSLQETNDKENYPLLTRTQLATTPFWIVGNPELGYRLTWGKYTFNDEPIETQEKLLTWYENHHWDITLHLIAIGISASNEPKNP